MQWKGWDGVFGYYFRIYDDVRDRPYPLSILSIFSIYLVTRVTD